MKYCSKCGRQLMDGEICNCDQQAGMQYGADYSAYNQYPYEQQGQVQGQVQMQDVVKQNAKGFFNKILELLKSPVEQGKNFVFSGDIVTAVIMIVIQGIASGLFAIVMCTKAQGIFDKITGMMYGSSSAADIMQMKAMLKMPVFKAFLITLIISVILTFILAGIIMIFNNISHSQLIFKNVISLVSLRSIVASIIVLVGCIAAFINIYAGIAVFTVGNIAGFMLIAVVWSHICQNTADKQIYMMIITYIIFMIIYMLAVRLCWKMYLPDVLKIALDKMQSGLKSLGNPSKAIEEIIDSL
ncbi:MAG: hypothetical protein MRZ68_10855 [Lachnospira sp.]|nr:hypothetical protein [Lachnospira sp.]